METIFALGLLHRPGGASFEAWRREANRKLHGRLVATNPIAARRRGMCLPDDLLCLVNGTRPATLGMSEAQTTGALMEIWQAVLAPYWPRVVAHLEAECGARSRIMTTGGVEQLLATLDPRIRWRPPVLEIDGGSGPDVVLDGRGLLLSPSVFVGSLAPPLIGTTRPTLVFAAPVGSAQAATLWGTADVGVRALGELVGRTRAAALRTMTVSCTTTELADRLGISSAGASQHAAILRRSGLITTGRIRNTVRHTVTPLGHALLGGRVGDGGAIAD